MQSLFVITINSQAHTGLCLRAVIVDDALTHVQGAHVQQVADISFYGLESGCLGNFRNLNASTLGGEVQNHTLVVGQQTWSLFLKVGIGADSRLALDLQA